MEVWNEPAVLFEKITMFTKSRFCKIYKVTSENPSGYLPHSHDYMQIWYITRGCCEHWVEGQKHLMARGDIFIVPPKVEHQVVRLEDAEIISCEFSFDHFFPPKENSAYQQVHEAARIACVHDVIEGFENGYDTVVGERGVTLSGGQKQRVAIARMLMQNAPILIFDDSMSAVDTETDASIRAALKHRRESTTTFIISHRITTLCEADKILVLEHGKLVEQGTHEELIAKPGLYRRIARIQNALEEELKQEGGGSNE